MNQDDKMFFISLASGSSGNCSYIGNHSNGFLIDAGIPYGFKNGNKAKNKKTLRQSLEENGIEIMGIKGLVISHCHFDHIRYAADYCTNNEINIPLYINENTYNIYEYIRARQKGNIKSYKSFDKINFFEPEKGFFIDDFKILPLPVRHDAYPVNAGNSLYESTFAFIIIRNDVIISHITDLGEISDNIIRHSQNSRILHLEFNYDPEMLLCGTYPLHLKKRIKSGHGHLSNQDAVRFIMKYHINTVEHISIAHISKENNSDDKISKSIEPIRINSNIKFHKTFHGHYSEKIFF